MPVLPAVLTDGTARHHVLLSTEHAASSHGLPVLVRDGQALGTAELPSSAWIEVHPADSISPTHLVRYSTLVEGARRAGYPVFAGGPALAGIAEIAERAGVKPDTVHAWRQRHADFPAPIVLLAAGPVWRWSDVARWLAVPRRSGRPRKS